MQDSRTPKKPLIPRWLLATWAIALAGIVTLRFFEVMNDPAMSNIASVALVLLISVITLAWLLGTRSVSGRTKALVLGALALVSVAVLSFFDFRIGGDLLPRLTPKFGKASADLDAARQATATFRADAPSFPGFLGPTRDNLVSTRLQTDLESYPPELLWRQPIGQGLAGIAIDGGYAATLEHRDERELATLYDVETGTLVWATTIDDGSVFGGGVIGSGPRTVPLISDGVVYVTSVFGRVLALDGGSGKILWQRDLAAEAGLDAELAGKLYPYGRSNSPVLVGDKLLVAPGGRPGEFVSLAALDKDNGETLWQGGSHQISMASPAVATLAGVDQVLLVNEDFVTGHGLESGAQLWEIPLPGKTSSNANVSNAVAVPPNRVFVSKGYGIGSGLWELTLTPSRQGADGPQFSASAIWQSARTMRTKFTNVAIQQPYVYGLSEGVLECIELETGDRVWKAGRYGHGQILLAGDVLVVLSEDGEIFYVRATPDERNEVLAEFQAIEGQTWNPFALAGDLLVVRNAHEMAAYRVPTL